MTVFGIGTTELILILLLLILIFGPQKITEMGIWLGQTYKKIAGISAELNDQVGQVRSTVKSTLDPTNIQNPLKEAFDEVNTIRKDVDKEIVAVKKDVDKNIADVKAVEKEIDSAKKDAEQKVKSATKVVEKSIAAVESGEKKSEPPDTVLKTESLDEDSDIKQVTDSKGDSQPGDLETGEVEAEQIGTGSVRKAVVDQGDNDSKEDAA